MQRIKDRVRGTFGASIKNKAQYSASRLLCIYQLAHTASIVPLIGPVCRKNDGKGATNKRKETRSQVFTIPNRGPPNPKKGHAPQLFLKDETT